MRNGCHGVSSRGKERLQIPQPLGSRYEHALQNLSLSHGEMLDVSHDFFKIRVSNPSHYDPVPSYRNR
jgi:hypothetical protein